MTRNRVIGRDGGMPWHLPADLRHFKAVTWGKPILMGRKTFESIGRPLPGRRNLVISRNKQAARAGVEWFASLQDALASCGGEMEVMIVGGGQLYAQALPLARRLWLTEIDCVIDGDTWFPHWDQQTWRLCKQWQQVADTKHAYALRFSLWERDQTSNENPPADTQSAGKDAAT